MITQIEQALIRCNGDVFASHCRTYLSYRYGSVFSTGLVLGKDKSKAGTPDNFIPINGYYIFVEITTQEKDILTKLKNDIEHCFNQKDVPKEKIAKIILIFNGQANLKIHEELVEHLKSITNLSELELIDLGSFADKIYREYPSIVKSLGINIDSGQILEIKEFVNQYEKSKFATTLSNSFFNRTQELESALEALAKSEIILISGSAGVGKTKFSLKLVQKFLDKNSNYQVKYITANGSLDIWGDLKSHLHANNNYLLVLDDANKLKTNLQLILNFLSSREENGNIKLILTVRNYVKKSVANHLNHFELIELKEFEKEELRNILQSKEFNISDYYVDRIYSISKGNPRIAIMAAIAGINNELEKLRNASQIYDKYFESVKQSINSFQDDGLLKIAGILALFKTIDFSNESQILEIEQYFLVPKNELLEKLRLLLQIELADEFNGVYKIADQILGEYIFYLIFIKDREIPFSKLLNIYVRKKHFPLTRILMPIINNYGFDSVKSYVINDIKSVWNDIKDSKLALNFIDDFWYFLPNDTLLFFQKRVNACSNENINYYSFQVHEPNQIQSYDDKIIELLSRFQNFENEFELALEILHTYGISSEVLFSKLLKVYTQGFNYQKYSYEHGYFVQKKLFDNLYRKIELNKEFYLRTILFIAPEYLKDSYRTTHSDGAKIFMGQYPIVLSEEMKQFRSKLWATIFQSRTNLNLKKEVQKFFFEFTQNLDYHNKVEQVINHDKELLLDFFERNFDFSDFIDNSIIENYISKLKWIKVGVNESLLENIKNRAYNVYLTFSDDKLKKRDFNFDLEKIDAYKEQEVRNLIKDYQEKDYGLLIEDLELIYRNNEYLSSRFYAIANSVCRLLLIVAEKDFDIFLVVLRKVLLSNFKHEIRLDIFNKLKLDNDKAFKLRELLKNKPFFFYLPNFHVGTALELLTQEDLDLFINYLDDKEINNFWYLTELLNKFKPFISEIENTHSTVVGILIKKVKSNKIYVGNDFYLYLHKFYNQFFYENIDLLQELYLYLDKVERHFDYNLKVLRIFLEDDPDFILQLLDSHFGNDIYISRSSLLENDFRKLWDMKNYFAVFSNIMDYFSKFHRISYHEDEVSRIFTNGNKKQINFLRTYLKTNSSENSILTVFNIVVSTFPDVKTHFLDLILEKNNSIELFKKLDFVITSITYSGSIVPRIRNRIQQLKSIEAHLKSLGDINLMEHISVIENRIFGYESDIEREMRREFVREWGI